MKIESISGQDAFNALIRHFMGDHYYIVEPIHTYEANYVILQEKNETDTNRKRIAH